MSKVVSVDQALDLIQDGATFATTGFIAAAMAETILRSMEERFKETGHPRDLTVMQVASPGWGKPGGGLDHLSNEGQIKRLIGGHFGLTPLLGKAMAENKFECYNFPLGVMAGVYRATIQGRKAELSKVGLKTYIDPRLEGGKMNDITKDDLIKVVEVDGEEFLSYPTQKIDICVLRGTCADEDGNITLEHEITPMETRTLAMATKACGGKVIFQVKHVVANGSLTADQVDIPGIFVDAVVITTDALKEHPQTMGSFYDPTLSGHRNVPMEGIPPLPLDERKVIARRAAMELSPNSVINLGIGVPEGVAVVAAEEGFGDQLTMTTESGVVGGIPSGGGDFGAGHNAMGFLDQRTMFDFYDGGGLDLAVLGLAECNAKGDINVSKFGPKLPGCGGFINISQNTHHVVFVGSFTAGGLELKIGDGKLEIVNEGKNKKFVNEVQQVTYSGEYGASIEQNVLYVTERAVFKLTKEGIVLTEIAPGIDLEKDVLGQMEFKPIIADDLKEMDPRIFRAEKMGWEL